MSIEALLETVARAPRAELSNLETALWKSWGDGTISDADAQAVAEAIHARKTAPIPPKPRRRTGSRPHAPESLQRRRKMAASGWMPPHLAAHFTQGEQAALAIVAQEIAATGDCRWPVGKIAALAGVGQSTARNAIREARLLGLLTVEERRVAAFRNLPNILRITSPEWMAWIRIGRKARGGGFKFSQRAYKQDLIKSPAIAQPRPRSEVCRQ